MLMSGLRECAGFAHALSRPLTATFKRRTGGLGSFEAAAACELVVAIVAALMEAGVAVATGS